MKKRARIIDKTNKNIYPGSQAQSPDSAIDDLSKPVSKETSKRTPTKITDNGFTVRKHSTKFTEEGMETEGDFIVAGYNPPWVPGFLARNEVLIQVKM